MWSRHAAASRITSSCIPTMDNDKIKPDGGAPPPYPDGDAEKGSGSKADALPPYDKDKGRPSSSPSLPPAYVSDRESITASQERPAVQRWTRKKRLCILGALGIIILAAAAVGAGVGVRQANARPPSPGAGGSLVTALAEGYDRNMAADNFEPRMWEFTNWLWHLAPDKTLAWKELTNGTQPEWTAYNPTRFLTVPSAERRYYGFESPSEVYAFAIEASTGAMMYHLGPWGADKTWHSLGGRFAYPPIVPPWSAVLGVTQDGQLYRRQRDWENGPVWRDWDKVGDGFAGGLSFAEKWSKAGMRVAALKDGTYQFMEFDHRDGDFPDDWRDLGRPVSCSQAPGAPQLFFETAERNVVLVSCAGRLWHKVLRGATWDAEWTRFEVGDGGVDGGVDELVHDAHGLQLVRISTRPAFLVSRTADRCYYGTSNEPAVDDPSEYDKYSWGAWTRLWCPSEEQRELATAVACDHYVHRCDMYREDVDGRVLHASREVPNQTEWIWAPLEGRVEQQHVV